PVPAAAGGSKPASGPATPSAAATAAEAARSIASRSKELKRIKPGQAEERIEGQSTTLVPDGRLLLMGGQGADGLQGSIAIKDPRSGDVSPASVTLFHPRAWHTATLLPDGTVLIVGGVGADGQLVQTAELFDPEAQTLQ